MKNDKGKMELKPYRANRYIEEFYEKVAGITGLTETVVKNIITKETKNPDIEARRYLDIFFNKDFYEKELGAYNDRCMDCKKKCRQNYYVAIIECPNYKVKKKKK